VVNMGRMLRLLVAGSRGFEGRVRDKKTGELEDAFSVMEHFLDKYYKDRDILVIHGGARGADTLADLYAEKRGCETKVFPANWEVEGKAAGLHRNTLMAEFCDECMCFWDGHSTGTEDTINKVSKYPHKILRVIRGWEPFDYHPVVKKR